MANEHNQTVPPAEDTTKPGSGVYGFKNDSETQEKVKDAVLVRRTFGGGGGGRPRRFDSDADDPTEEEMNELDENGWAHVHHAAYRGFVKSVERFVKANEDQLEMETGDDLHSTPLLLAVMSGNLETVETLVELGAKVFVMNSQNHGVVELCAFKQFISVLEFFIKLGHEKLPVWKNLIKFMGSEIDDECEAAAKCLRTLTQGNDEGMNANWKPAYDNGLIPAIVKVIKGSISDNAKVAVQHVLLNMLPMEECKAQCISSGGMPPLVRHLKSPTNYLIQLSAECIKVLSTVSEYADVAAQNGAIPALVKVVQTEAMEPEVLVEVMDALGTVCEDHPQHQNTLMGTPGAVKAVVDLFDDCTNKSLQMALTRSVSQIVSKHDGNQCAFVNEGVAAKIIPLVRLESKKHLDLQLSAVESISKLAEDNPTTQKIILEAKVVPPLHKLLTRSRQQDVQEKTACALWSLAGDDVEARRSMAEAMNTQMLIEFLSSMSEDLHFIGSEGLGVLAQGPLNKQDEIAKANGVHPLVRLLRSDKEYIVLSVIRTIRYLCVGVGYVPHPINQATVAQSRGVKFLVALMVHSQNELIQVEAAHTLGSAALGNAEILEEIHQNIDFSYVRLLKMMYAKDDMVRLLAGAALAAFAFNNLQNQKDIAEQGGIRFNCYVPFLQSEDEYFRCQAAFQVVVLARIIPDEEQAISSAAGIKLLVDLLNDSKSDVILALTADCIARLAHTRAGVPAAFISIDCVNLLCNLLGHQAEQVQGCAAITLGYLSYNHQAKREILNRCRVEPKLMKILKHYTSSGKLNPEIADGWKHYKQIGLPKIEEGRTTLIGRKSFNFSEKENGRPHTITSFDDTGGSTNLQSSPTNMNSSQLMTGDGGSENKTPGRSSRGSGSRSTNTLTPRPAGSVVGGSGGGGGGSQGQRSRRTSVLSGELPAEIMAGNS